MDSKAEGKNQFKFKDKAEGMGIVECLLVSNAEG